MLSSKMRQRRSLFSHLEGGKTHSLKTSSLHPPPIGKRMSLEEKSAEEEEERVPHRGRERERDRKSNLPVLPLPFLPFQLIDFPLQAHLLLFLSLSCVLLRLTPANKMQLPTLPNIERSHFQCAPFHPAQNSQPFLSNSGVKKNFPFSSSSFLWIFSLDFPPASPSFRIRN